MNKRQSFDVVIVGAGPAGIVLASRLTEDPGCTVALIEAGPDYGAARDGWPVEMRDGNAVALDSHPWGFANSNPEVALSRARVVGGSSTVNACYWMRGSAVDYDEWEAIGNPGWGFDDLLPYFKRAETDPMGGEFHGTNGPVPISRVPTSQWSKIDQILVDSATSIGLPYKEDINDTAEQTPCVGPAPRNLEGSVRLNAVFTYLNRARNRPNLSLIPNTQVDRVLVDSARALGVITTNGAQILGRSIIVSAGAYATPAILMRSGIGEQQHLRAMGIRPIVDLPGVGEHLMDHPLVGGLLECEIAPGYEPDGVTYGPTMIKGRGSQSSVEIDLHYYQGQVWNSETGRWNLWFSTSLQYAGSAGRLRLKSADPLTLPEIDHAYFSEARDLAKLCDAVEFINNFARTTPLGEVVQPIPSKSLQWKNRDELRDKIRAQVGTTYHASSTCRMGPSSDSMAVVDQQACVYGVDGLRVVDTSIFPTIPRCNIHFPVVATAEKIADAIRNNP